MLLFHLFVYFLVLLSCCLFSHLQYAKTVIAAADGFLSGGVFPNGLKESKRIVQRDAAYAPTELQTQLLLQPLHHVKIKLKVGSVGGLNVGARRARGYNVCVQKLVRNAEVTEEMVLTQFLLFLVDLSFEELPYTKFESYKIEIF